MGLVEINDAYTKAVEYRVVAQLLRYSNFKGKTTLKRIEPHRLKELILEDVRIYNLFIPQNWTSIEICVIVTFLV